MINGDYAKLDELYSEAYKTCHDILEQLKDDAPDMFNETSIIIGIEIWPDGIEMSYASKEGREYVFVPGYIFEENSIAGFCKSLIEERRKAIWN